jgi:hypothetical protein
MLRVPSIRIIGPFIFSIGTSRPVDEVEEQIQCGLQRNEEEVRRILAMVHLGLTRRAACFALFIAASAFASNLPGPGDPAPDFSLTSQSGSQVSLSRWSNDTKPSRSSGSWLNQVRLKSYLLTGEAGAINDRAASRSPDRPNGQFRFLS